MITDMTTPNPFAMNSDELMAFLAEPRFMAATTLRKDGTPITIFLGFEWDGEAMVFSLRNSRLLNRRLARNSRIVMAVTNEFAPAKYVVMEGNAEIIPDDDREISIRGLARYMSPDSDFQTQKDIDFDGFIDDTRFVQTALGTTKPKKDPNKAAKNKANPPTLLFSTKPLFITSSKP